MTCEEVREALLQWSLPRLGELEPHLRDCPECRALRERIQSIEGVIAMDIESFQERGDFDEAWDAASEAPAASRIHGLLIVLAAAAVLVVTGSSLILGSGAWLWSRQLDSSPVGIVGIENPVPVCGLPSALKTSAEGGLLDAAEVSCLEGMVERGGEEARAASELLLTHWWTLKDLEAWRSTAEVHVEVVDPRDSVTLLRLATVVFEQQPALGRPEVSDLLERARAGRIEELPGGGFGIDALEARMRQSGSPPSSGGVGGPVLIFAKGYVGSDLHIDGVYVGTLPARVPDVTPGVHTFVVAAAGGDITFVQEVVIDPSGNSTVLTLQ